MVLGEWPSSNSDRDAGKPMSAERSISGASGNGSRMPMSAGRQVESRVADALAVVALAGKAPGRW